MTQPGPSDANASWTCTEVLAHIYEFIDGALPAASDERVRRHIASCAHCRPNFEQERRFLELLSRCAKTERCPEEVRRRILESLGRSADDA